MINNVIYRHPAAVNGYGC